MAVLSIVLVTAALFQHRTVVWVCPYCRATRTSSTYFYIPFPEKIEESRVTAYWRAQVEPAHVHLWAFRSRGEGSLLSGYVADSFPSHWYPILRLSEDAELAILRGLRTPDERRRFVQSTFQRTRGMDPAPAVENAVSNLRSDYEENPKRTDWPQLIRKRGLAP